MNPTTAEVLSQVADQVDAKVKEYRVLLSAAESNVRSLGSRIPELEAASAEIRTLLRAGAN